MALLPRNECGVTVNSAWTFYKEGKNDLSEFKSFTEIIGFLY